MTARLPNRAQSIRSMVEQARRLGPPADDPAQLLRFVRQRFPNATQGEVDQHLAAPMKVRPAAPPKPGNQARRRIAPKWWRQ